jgi:TatD DNase family protein
MEIARDLNKPVIFHNRDADQDLISILSEFPDVKGVAHCFSSTLETAEKFIDLGYYISFSGNLTFKNSHLPDIAKEIPLDRLLIETDCPYLSPDPHRGKTNEPSRVRFVAEKLADIHCLPFEKIAEVTSNNATDIFEL